MERTRRRGLLLEGTLLEWMKVIQFGVFVALFFFLDSYYTEALDFSQCTVPLGMESGEIPDSDITASSTFENGNVGPHIGRVRVERQGGAWCPKNVITSDAEEWIQIDLHTVHVITATETQGRFGNGQGQEYSESYLVMYWRPHLNRWVRYRDYSGTEIRKGNINTYLASKTELNPPIIASKIRILPYSHHQRTVCMRVEIYGCRFRGGLLSYSMPQGSKRGENWEFYDQTYDGVWDGSQLRDGLGQLTDGRVGPTNFKDDFYGPERGKGWVGWKNDSRNATDPLEITFNFDSVREFNAVSIHISNQFTKEVQVFSEARLFFSVGGKLYPGDPVRYIPMEDCIFEDPKNISIKLHHKIGQHVKIQLFWAAKWILVSEISFDSQPAMGNFTDEAIIPVVNNSTKSSTVLSTSKPSFSTSTSTQKVHNQASRAVMSNPSTTVNVPKTVMDESHKVVEDFTSTTIVVTAVISSLIAIGLVLVMILAAFLIRNRFLPPQDKVPHQQDSMLYATFNSFGGGGGVGGGGGGVSGVTDCNGYASPAVLFAQRDSSGGSKKLLVGSESTEGHSSSREYEQPSFSSFIGSPPVPVGIGGSSSGGQTSSNGTMKSRTNNKAEYYSCTPVPNPILHVVEDPTSFNEYEYVVPKSDYLMGTLNSTTGIGGGVGVLGNSGICKSPGRRTNPNSPHLGNRFRTIQLRFRELGLPEISKRRLKMVRKLGDGVFGTVYIGELEMPSSPLDRRLVAVKHLLRNATEKDKLDFLEEVRLLSSLNDPNVTQVLGVSCEEEPYSVILEFLEMGDLCQFLRQNGTLQPNSSRKLSLGGLLHLAGQIASGMKFLECRNIVHRDLATRNCVVSRGLTVKISHFATDTDLYATDYYRLDGKMPLPIRWMAWESLFLGKYSTKSDVWSFGVTLWEILTLSRHSPYPELTDQEVIHNLRRLSIYDETDPFEPLEKPFNCSRDIYDLLCDTWRRNDEDRPSFWEIHCFLTRKNLNFHVPQGYLSNSSSYVEHYIV